MSEEHTPQEHTEAHSESLTRTVAQPSWKQNIGIPGAIVFSALLIAGAIYFDGGAVAKVDVQDGIAAAQNAQETAESIVAPVSKDDHIRGNPNAPIVIVEYSDFDCPFCKNFHETMNKVMAKYGASGEVAWVYRNFPLAQLHVNAPKIAAAGYCVSEQGGNDSFWKFSDLIFGEREVNAPTDLKRLPEFATRSGVDSGKFEACLTSGKYDEKVAQDITAAAKTGARGTPYSIVLVGDQQGVINGAQPYDTVEQILENLIGQLEGTVTTE